MQNNKIYHTIKYWPQSKILKGTPEIIIVVTKPELLKYNTTLYFSKGPSNTSLLLPSAVIIRKILYTNALPAVKY